MYILYNKYDHDYVLSISFFTIQKDTEHTMSITCNQNGSAFNTLDNVRIIRGLTDSLIAIERDHKRESGPTLLNRTGRDVLQRNSFDILPQVKLY